MRVFSQCGTSAIALKTIYFVRKFRHRLSEHFAVRRALLLNCSHNDRNLYNHISQPIFVNHMVRAENNINSILEALKNGAFYSSCGPEIYNFYVEDGKAIVDCSSAARIRFHSDMHPTGVIRSADGTLTHAEFNLGDRYKYIRATIIDKNVKYAWTNPISSTDEKVIP